MKKTLLLSLLLFFSTSSIFGQGKLFIIGGGSRPASLINAMIDESGLREGGYAIVLPMSSSEPERAIESGVKQLVENGISSAVGFNFIKGTTPSTSKIDSLTNATLIYISGGSQNRFMEVVTGTTIEKALWDSYKNGGTIAGTSAGAAVMSEKMINGDQVLYPDATSGFRVIERGNTSLSTGLGFVKTAIIDQHFVKRSRHNRLITLAIENPKLKCIGIDESTAIVVSDNKAKVYGASQVLVFSGAKGKRSDKDLKLGMKNINLSIYLAGDQFKLR